MNTLGNAEEGSKGCKGWFKRRPNAVPMLHVHVVMAIHSLGMSLSLIFVQNLVLQRFCQQKFPVHVCAGKLNSTVENAIQTDAAQFLLFKSLANQVPPMLLAFTMGYWSDLHGRKSLMIFSTAGSIATYVIYLLCSYFDHWPMAILFVASIPMGLTGSSISFMLGFFGYVKDISSNRRMSTKISIADGIAMIGMQVGPLIGAQLYHNYGYPSVFIASILVMCTSLISIVVLIDEGDRYPKCDWTTTVKDLFRIRAFVDSVKLLLVKRQGNRRAYIIGANLAFLIVHFGQSVDWGIDLMNYYNVTAAGCSAIGFLVLVPLFTNRAHLNDAAIGIIGLAFKWAYYFGTAFTFDTPTMFAVALCRMPAAMVTVTTRSFVAKCVSRTEIGKLLAVYSLLQAITTNVATTTSTQIYVLTKDDFEGAIFVICGAILIVPTTIYLLILIDLKKKHLVLERDTEEQLAIKSNDNDSCSTTTASEASTAAAIYGISAAAAAAESQPAATHKSDNA